MSAVITTDRLVLRPWRRSDVDAATTIFGRGPGTAWLPGDPSGTDKATMAAVLEEWVAQNTTSMPAGRWAIELEDRNRLIGACSLQFGEPGPNSLKLRWLLDPSACGYGYATEAGNALIGWAMHQGGVHEVFAIVEPDNARALAVAGRMGMDLVGETGRYGRSKLQVYRVRHGDLPFHEEHGDTPAEVDTGTWMEPHAGTADDPTAGDRGSGS
jgi:RimJ/RimL family protein N-acetyltransferase